MNTNMSSIRSVLIRTSMANIQKEVSQLEHWLNNLPDDVAAPPIPRQPCNSYNEHTDLSHINRFIERINDEVSNQRLTLSNILERIDNLEGFQRPDREVFIDETVEQHTNCNDPWLDSNCEPLANEVIGSDDTSEPLYKYTGDMSRETSVGTPSIVPDIPEDKSILPDIDSDNEDEKIKFPPQMIRSKDEKNTPVINNVEEEEEEEEEEKETVEVEEEEEEEETVEVEVEEEEETVEVEEEEEKETVEVKEEEEEEEEEEGKEFEEIEYNGKRYYKDDENFIYSVNEDDEPSENPVGYWKEKSQTIAFYKTK